jgi:putative addiction module component (TIGR02574 family)
VSPSASTILAEVRKLSPADRLELIGEIWDSLDYADLPVTDEERAILESRMADLEANPAAQEPMREDSPHRA